MHQHLIKLQPNVLTGRLEAADVLRNWGKGNIKHLWQHIDVKTVWWSAWFGQPALEQTCSFQCKKTNTQLRKQLRQWVWMAVSQASLTPGHGPNSSLSVGGKRPTAIEVEVGQKHLWLNTKLFCYVWMPLLEVLLKCFNNHPLCLWRRLLRHCEILREGRHQGWHCLSVVVTSTRSASKQHLPVLLLLCSYREIQISSFFFFWCQQLVSMFAVLI